MNITLYKNKKQLLEFIELFLAIKIFKNNNNFDLFYK